MKRKSALSIICLLVFSGTSFSQIRLPVQSGLRSDLQKIVAEYPGQFAAIRGEVVDYNPQSTEYRSKLRIADAEQCKIVAYSSGTRPVYSWQAQVFVSEDFEAAAKKYRWLYQQVKGANLYYLKDQYTLRGSYHEADESRGFAVSSLSLVNPPVPYQRLRVDVSLQFEFPEWKVQLTVYEKERDDDEPGTSDVAD